LTRPVLPQAAAIDYTPSQYLCEFIKKCGYQGVVYRSSVSDGINLALFYPALAMAGAVTQFRVTRVSVDVVAATLEHGP
jgi:RES domain